MSILTQSLISGAPLMKARTVRHVKVPEVHAAIQATSVAAPVRTQIPVIEFDKTAAQDVKQQISAELKQISKLEDSSR